MEVLSKYVAKLGGRLGGGWRCNVRKRAGPGNRVDTYFISPAGEKFRCAPNFVPPLGSSAAMYAPPLLEAHRLSNDWRCMDT